MLKLFLAIIIFTTFVSILYPIWPRIFDILLSINETQSRRSSLFITEYFIDHKRYFYLISFHASAAFVIGIIAMSATGTMFIVYLQHACGLFRITW